MQGILLRRTSWLVALLVVVSMVGVAPAHAQNPTDAEPPSVQVPALQSGRLHVDHPAQTSGQVVGTMRIPAIGLDEVIREGVSIEVINEGPAHWGGTPRPGGDGNVVIAGHRTTYGGPFRHLDQLEPGHLVYFTDPRGFDVMYRIVDTFIVDPTAIWITYQTSQPLLTMFACHPVGSAAQRIVVRAELVAGGRIA